MKAKPRARDERGRYSTAERVAMDMQRPVLARRCALMGWPTDDMHMRRARDQRMATLYGRLFLAGAICEDAHDGIHAYAHAWGRYLSAIRAPRPWPLVPALDGLRGGPGGDDDQEAIHRATMAHMASVGILARQGAFVRDAVLRAIEASDDVGPLHVRECEVVAMRLGGRELARHFGLRA